MKPDDNPTDDELMGRGARGDPQAFRRLVERWERPVHAFLERMTGSPDDAMDLTQETFVRMCRSASRYRPTGRFKSWLFRIAGNLARSRLQRRKILRWLPLTHEHAAAAASDPDPSDILADREEQRIVQEAIARLPERQRQALVLKQFQDMRYQEIADAMGSSVSSVQMLLHRAMTALRKDLASRRDRL